MDGATEIKGFADAKGCAAFPLGAGGGGTVLIIAPDPNTLKALRANLTPVYREVSYRVMKKGHQLINMPLETC